MKSNKNGVKLLAAVAVLAMVASVFVVVADSDDAAGETNVIDISTSYSESIDNSELGNILSSTENGITGYVAKITDDTLNNAITATWSEAGKEKTYEYALVFTIDIEQDKYVTFVGSDNSVKSIQVTDGKLTVLKYINDSNKDKAFVYAVTDDEQTTMPATTQSVSIDVELAEAIDPTTSIFNEGGDVKLNTNYIFTKTCDISKDTIVTMNGFDIVGSTIDIFDVSDGAKFTINGDEDSKVISNTKEGLLSAICDSGTSYITINGGYYEAPYVIVTGVNSDSTSTLNIKNATIVAKNSKYTDGNFYSEGIWASYNGLKTVNIENTVVESEGLGIYLGVTAESVLNNVTVTSVGTALEIKSGNVEIIGGSFTSSSYTASDCTIGSSGSGSGEDTICINNGYSRTTTGSKVTVTFSDDVIFSNTKTSKPVQIVAGCNDKKVAHTDPITVVGVDLGLIEVKIVEGGANVDIKTTDSDSTPVVTETPTETITSDVIFAMNGDVLDANINVDDKSNLTISTGDNEFSGSISLGTGGDLSSITVSGLKGTVTFSKGSVVAAGDIEAGSIELPEGEVLKLKVDFRENFEIIGPNENGKVATVLIEDGTTTSIASGKTLKLTGNIKMNNDGELIGGGVINVPSTAQFYTSKPVSVSFTGNGKIVLEDAIETLRLSDKLASSLTTEPTQKVIVTGNLTIKSGQVLTIQGDLEVPEGVTVTIEKGGKLIINGVTATANIAGTIKSAGSFEVKNTGSDGIAITGTVSAEDADSVKIDALTNLDGTISVSSKGTATFTKDLYVSETGIVDIKGTVTGNIYNQGTVNINGSVASTTTVYMAGVDAVVDIQSLKTGTLTVSDAGLYLKTVGTDKKVVPTGASDGWITSINSMTFTNVKGVKVTEGIVYETVNDARSPYNYMYISGTASVADSKNMTNNAPVIVISTGKVTVADEFSFSKVAVTVNATLSVTGTVNMSDEDGTEFTDATGELIVTGLVKTIGTEIEDFIDVSAVKYEKRVDTKTEYYYTNLADAIASGVSDLEVFGDIVISKDTTIPAGISIDAGGKTVTVENKVTLTVADGGYLEFGAVNVDGTFYIENTDTGVNKTTGITSDTSVITEKTAMYTNLVNALANAESGEIRITKGGDQTVILSEDATIGENVTLTVPSSKTLKIRNGVTLTVNGTLDNKGTIGSEKIADAPATVQDNGFGPSVKKAEVTGADADKLYSVIKVNGMIVSSSPMTYGTEFSTTGYSIPGAYYQAKVKYYITTVEKSADAIKTADDCKVQIYGENKVGTVAFEGTASTPVSVEVNDKIVAESMTVKFGTMTFTSGTEIDGTFGSSVGSVKVTNMAVDSTANNTFAINDSVVTIDEKDVQKVAMSGYIETNDSKVKPTVEFTGDVESSMKIKVEYGSEKYGSVDVDGTVTITGNTSVMEIEDSAVLTIAGTVIANNGGEIKAPTIVVLGILDVQEKTDKLSAGKITVNNLYIGGTTADVKSVAITTNAAASVNAPESNVKAVYLFPGSTVTGGLKAAMDKDGAKYTEFYVEDALWLTVYDISAGSMKIAVEDGSAVKYNFTPTLKEKKFVSWQSRNGSAQTDVAKDTVIGGVTSVYAKINYNVYDVKVQVADGIDDVYIDGVLMGKASSGNLTFEASVTAGQHTISYTLSNGYGGEAVMYINGEKTTGYTFSASGSFGSDTEYNIILQGIEKTGYTPDAPDNTGGDSDDGMSITDYLLIVLVVLIVIMAILVAVRMMRS